MTNERRQSPPAEPAALILQGLLCSGLGEGAGFIALEWVGRQCRDKLGFQPHPGTVNLRLSGQDWAAARDAMQCAPGIVIDPPPGFCAAKCFAVVIDGCVEGAAILPEVDAYPEDKLEIVAPIALRQALHLRDGDPFYNPNLSITSVDCLPRLDGRTADELARQTLAVMLPGSRTLVPVGGLA